jgi:hypothetical protein
VANTAVAVAEGISGAVNPARGSLMPDLLAQLALADGLSTPFG